MIFMGLFKISNCIRIERKSLEIVWQSILWVSYGDLLFFPLNIKCEFLLALIFCSKLMTNIICRNETILTSSID